jgi:exodeoxyribonuclease VII large subunit
VLLLPVRVQGAGAAEEIAQAIEDFNRYGKVDVLIVGRGGGSLEDLWAFNEETVARAIYASDIPVISAVGHEIDFSIADFVADLRAPTPSAAAELVVRDRLELLEVLKNYSYTMHGVLEDSISSQRERVQSLVASYSFNRPRDLVRESVQRIDELERSVTTKFSHLLQLIHQRYRTLEHRLEALSPRAVLGRGYALVRKGGKLVVSARTLHAGDDATIQFHDGEVLSKVQS